MPPKKPQSTQAKKPTAAKATKPAVKGKTTAVKKTGASSTSAAGAAAAPPPAEVKPVIIDLPLKQLTPITEDGREDIKESGKFPMLIDEGGQATTFLKYRNSNYLNATNVLEMVPETVRLALVGSIRYGKCLVIDFEDGDHYETLKKTMEEIQPGLMETILNKSIRQEEKFLSLLKKTDGEEYHENQFSPFYTEKFQFIIVTKNPTPSELMTKMIVFRINV